MQVFIISKRSMFDSCADFVRQVESNKVLQKKVNVMRSISNWEIVLETNPTKYWEVFDEVCKIYRPAKGWSVTIIPVFSQREDSPKLSIALERDNVEKVMCGPLAKRKLWCDSVINSFSTGSYAHRSNDFPLYRKTMLDLLFKTDLLDPLVGTRDGARLALTCTALSSKDDTLCNYVDRIITEEGSITDTTWVKILGHSQDDPAIWSAFFKGAVRHPRRKWITQDLAKMGLKNLLDSGPQALTKEGALRVFYACLREAVYGKDPFDPNSVEGFKRVWNSVEYDSRVPMDLSVDAINSNYRRYLKLLVKADAGDSPEVQEVTRELLRSWSGSPRELIDTVKSAIS